MRPQPNKREHTHVSNRLNAPFSATTCHNIWNGVSRLASASCVYFRFADNLIYLPHACSLRYIMECMCVCVSVSVLLFSNATECAPNCISFGRSGYAALTRSAQFGSIPYLSTPIKIKFQKAINFIGCWFYIFISPVEGNTVSCNESYEKGHWHR